MNVQSSSNKSLTTGLLVVLLTAVGLVAWLGDGALSKFRGDAKVEVESSVPEEGGKKERCASVACEPLSCQDHERPYLRPGACCPRCVPQGQGANDQAQEAQDCSAVQCEACPPDALAEQVAGECCPVCRLQSKACDEGRGKYEQKVAGLEAELTACKSDEDCIVASYSDSCRYKCPSPVNRIALGKVVEQLRALGSEHCGSCFESKPLCAAQDDQSVVCRAGACAFAFPR